MEQELRLRIILENPPSGIDFALQKGKGNNYQPEQKQRSGSADPCFDFNIKVKSDKISPPDFSGPFVQGARGARFIYIDIGTYAGQAGSEWGRRLKIPLAGITQELIEQAFTTKNSILETTVPGTGKDGGPNCATVKPFPGWSLAK